MAAPTPPFSAANLSALLREQEELAARVRAAMTSARAASETELSTNPPAPEASTGLPQCSPAPRVVSPNRRSPRIAAFFPEPSSASASQLPPRALSPPRRAKDMGHRRQRSPTVQFNLFGRRTTVGVVSVSSAPASASSSSAPSASVPPATAGHERQRAMKQKAPKGPRGRAKASRITKETSVSIAARVKEFPEQSLKDSANGLLCLCCAFTLPNIVGSIKRHLKTDKHIDNLRKFKLANKSDATLRADLADYFTENPDESMASVRLEVHELRCRLVETFLVSGTPLDRVKFFRPLLERFCGTALTDESHLNSYVPKIEVFEFKRLKLEIKGQYLTISFDGTSRLGEAVNLVGRWIDEGFNIQQRLLRFITLVLHMNADALSSLLTEILCVDLSVPPKMLVCMSRDSVAVNGVCCANLARSPFTGAENVMCISHTLNNVGSRISFDLLSDFMTPWLELVGGRHPHAGAKALWRAAVAPQKVPGFSNIRWYSKAEIQFVLAENFHRLDSFMADLDQRKYGSATRQRLHGILDDRDKSTTLKLQLAAMLDMRLLVRTTYELEGDRLEILLVHERIEVLRALGRGLASGAAGLLPNVNVVLQASTRLVPGVKIKKAFGGHGTYEAIIISSEIVESTLYPGTQRRAFKVRYPSDRAVEDLEEEEIRPLICTDALPERKEIVDALLPAFNYLESRILGTCEANYDCSHMYEVCRVVRVFDPTFAAAYLTSDMIDELVMIRPLHVHVDVSALKTELPAYLSAAKGEAFGRDDVAAYTHNVLRFWRSTSSSQLKAWRTAARIVFSISPNSASCERVFSLLASMFTDEQQRSLADKLQASLMLRYNKRVNSSSVF